jgi:hypothetical protein
MGTITRSFANNLTTGGVLKADAFNNASLNNVTALNAAIATGNMILLSSQTASASATISFTTGIDSTYKEYQFWFINMHPATDGANFQFNLSTDGGSNYNVTKTSSAFSAFHSEAGTDPLLAYATGNDLAQSTHFKIYLMKLVMIMTKVFLVLLTLFNPASTTYVKHFISRTHHSFNLDYPFRFIYCRLWKYNICNKCYYNLRCLVETLMMAQS